MIHFTVPGEPQGKARGRTFIHNSTGKATTMTPEKTVNYEALVKMMYLQSTKEFCASEPLKVVINAYYTIPVSTSKRKKSEMLEGQIRPTKKPDADNVAKIICDSLNGIAYKDDAHIVHLAIFKHYATVPRVEVEISTICEGEK